ncbi:queuosine 5'-phosphate N-glycosylase/hydrolase [Brevipalpus obovatus]|uniref:queuosine 5'-phosphate N-glycosylase/hydrolase n=1 Tax=Brevipalpus obovatus TaxID=246614 RepID=UPI003D9E0E0B
MVMSPRESGKYIAKLSKNVQIDNHSIEKLAEHIFKAIVENGYKISSWKQTELHPDKADEKAIDWIFLIDSLNFSFWSNNPFYVLHKGRRWGGYFGLCAAIERAMNDGIPITDPNFYKEISLDQLQHILRTNNSGEPVEFPMIEERLEILHSHGKILCEKYDGSFVNCIKRCDKSAVKLLSTIIENFPSFRDEAEFEGKRVSFYKRAQILIGDIWACFENKELGHFVDIDQLTIFADYRVPQILAYEGVLKYSQELKSRLQDLSILTSGERDEIEIRGTTIEACELLLQAIKKKFVRANMPCPDMLNAITLDYYLWNCRLNGGDLIDKAIQFHRQRSIYY